MKKSVIFLCVLMPVLLVAQVSSWEGKGISPKGTLFCLNIFVNVIYDIHPEYNQTFTDSTYWAPVTDVALEGINNTSIPKYLLDWMDTMYFRMEPALVFMEKRHLIVCELLEISS